MPLCRCALLVALFTPLGWLAQSTPTKGTVTEVSSFTVPKSPSGMFFFTEQSLLYILCGTQTNGDHYLYAYTTAGQQRCFITIPQAVGMTRVDGFYIVGSVAYIVDSQGPIYASTAGKLGGSVYQVEWTNPCSCSSGATCSSSSATWSPTVTKTWSLAANAADIDDGGGADNDFRNSGIVVVGDYWYGVNGVHPIGGSLTGAYPKSIVKVAMSATTKDSGNAEVTKKWSFDGTTLGHDVDMEGLTCGQDDCANSLYVGDEYNYIYKFDLNSGEVPMEWDLNSIVGNVRADKGVESLTYASSTKHFYAGIQDTAKVHVLSLSDEAAEPDANDNPGDDSSGDGSGSNVLWSECTATSDFPECSAPKSTQRRVRKEVRALTAAEWDKVVAAMWAMKQESMASGKTKYGEAFRTYDYFVVKHAVATTDTRGDQAHFGAHFMTWHGAFVLEFENALLAVDSSISALPYWDQTIKSPSVFTDTYFGPDPDAATSNQITTGKFANWPVTTSFSLADYDSYITDDSTVNFVGNPSGFLRGADNTLTNAFVTRYGSGSDWENTAPSAADWWACTSDASHALWNDWYTCIEAGQPSFHSGPHGGVGGRGNTGERGDFEDPITSPNAPIFMFHHANMDRNKAWWMLMHGADKCSYYGFPLTDAPQIGLGGGGGGGGGGGNGERPAPGDGAPPNGPPPGRRLSFVGAHLNDVVSSTWGFTKADLGFEGDLSGQLTHADLLCWMGPETAAYTYDTHAECSSADNCHESQGTPEPAGADSGTGDSTNGDGATDADSARVVGLHWLCWGLYLSLIASWFRGA
eukprot:CAMPEP_0171064830 /NCGR_PEP_ID=MMETSP0766_2-20121228/6512_1 /TAXON_ID=439317 /ORGANISM="Gambierdiscus australes, Strain CAWD 149" /LENGTH=806 /DNA_ID=CAMNT_0011520897 /DNA_START=45 /DNA_END=2465 /DNA_ORIENTATION=-